MAHQTLVAAPCSTEEFDTDTGRHLGNFPQAFSHLALIEAAARIISPSGSRSSASGSQAAR